MTASSSMPQRSNRLLRLSVIIPSLTVGLVFAACTAVGVIGYVSGRDGLEKAAKSELELVVNGRQALLNAKLANIEADLTNAATSAGAALLMKDLAGTRVNIESDMPAIREYYQPAGMGAADRAARVGTDNKTMYSWRHSELHSAFMNTWKLGGYGDIYGVLPDGYVLYSVTKGQDFLTSVTDPAMASTGLAEAFSNAANKPAGTQVATGFAPYAVAGGAPSFFVAQPVVIETFGEKKFMGVMALRVGAELIDGILADRDGMGDTGQSYLVGEGGTVLSNMPLANQPTALVATAKSAPILQALSGVAGSGEVAGDDGVTRFLVARPLTFMGKTYAVVAEKTLDEAMASVTAMRDQMILWTLITLAGAAVVALVFARSITRPLTILVRALESIAAGNLTTDIAAARRGDEIGEIGRAVVAIRENAAAEQERRTHEEGERGRNIGRQRKEMLANLARDFEATVGKVVESVSQSAHTLQNAANDVQQMTAVAGDSASRAADMSSQAMNEVQSIASASDQLSGSIRQISELIHRSSSVAQTATVRAQATNATVRSLAEAANRIGEVVTLISDIADQTNLLALNATIEAARAGEAGRGFAVVASEVKELASQTGKATGEIQQQIDAIRSATEDAVAAIGDIQETINEITVSVTEVSSAVEEQSAATQGIAANTQRAARGTAEVSSNIRRVNEVTDRTGAAASGFVASAGELSQQASHLDQEVRAFLAQVRSA
ncbi:methyl-accepting chemotaxis protein [Pannonibacter sp. SL95]|uniref:methyl-accepting chemotaxis protein n=1 Tax=Pannonibacter sp. SL95 TaxID=2995153 RepID=UPI0022746C58|nr:methyl-accepting chemotaxis protein [Pannonibacter sp. SL95]MCY1705915.1 methyl-accepting chemotaxis protein [Pannonibacter sp. SL95]